MGPGPRYSGALVPVPVRRALSPAFFPRAARASPPGPVRWPGPGPGRAPGRRQAGPLYRASYVRTRCRGV